MKPLILTVVVALSCANAASAFRMKYAVKVRADKRTDFSKIKTYTWMVGSPASDPTMDAAIEIDVDRELAALGLTKRAAAPCDAIVSYQAAHRTDVDLKSGAMLGREYPAGFVIVRLLDPRDNTRELFRGRADMALETDPSRLRTQIQTAITRIFARYPTRRH